MSAAALIFEDSYHDKRTRPEYGRCWPLTVGEFRQLAEAHHWQPVTIDLLLRTPPVAAELGMGRNLVRITR